MNILDVIHENTEPFAEQVTPILPVADTFGTYDLTDGVHAIEDIRFSSHLMRRGERA